MIATLNIVAKTFAKFAKTFDGLAATIVAKRRRPVLILHLEEKYAKIDYKNEIYTKNWVRKTWTKKKVNSKKSQRSKSTSQSKSMWSTVSSDDVIVAEC